MKAIGIPFIFFLFSLAVMVSCEKDNNKTPPPARVILVEKSADDDAWERGIDAVPDEDAIYLEWHPNREKTLEGYAIYRSEEENRNYREIGRVVKRYEVLDTTFTDKTVSIGVTYYYYLRAYNTQGSFGAPSDTVHYHLLQKPLLLAPLGNINTGLPVFSWNYPSGFPPDQFIFRLQKLQPDTVNILINKLNIRYEFPENWTLSELGLPDTLATGKYRWRIDPYANEFKGSESRWGDFVVQ